MSKIIQYIANIINIINNLYLAPVNMIEIVIKQSTFQNSASNCLRKLKLSLRNNFSQWTLLLSNVYRAYPSSWLRALGHLREPCGSLPIIYPVVDNASTTANSGFCINSGRSRKAFKKASLSSAALNTGWSFDGNGPVLKLCKGRIHSFNKVIRKIFGAFGSLTRLGRG